MESYEKFKPIGGILIFKLESFSSDNISERSQGGHLSAVSVLRS